MWVAHVAIGPSVKRGQVSRDSVFKFFRAPFTNGNPGILLTSDVRLLLLHVVDASRPFQLMHVPRQLSGN